MKRTLWKSDRGLLLLVAIGIGFSLALFALVRELRQQQVKSRFASDARNAVASIQRAVDDSAHELEAMSALYHVFAVIDREQFATFVEPFLKRSRVIQALEWVPRVDREERPDFERKARAWNPKFEITERNAQGGLVTAADRPEYFPVAFVEPLKGNQPAVGFDIASEPIRRAAIERMRATRRPAATEPVRLVQERRMQKGFLVLWPNFAPDGTLLSFSLGVFRAVDLIDGALAASQSRGIAVRIVDAAAGADPLMYSSAAHSSAEAGDLRYVAPVDVAGRTWTVSCWPATSAARGLGAEPWLAFLGALAFTTILAIYFSARARAELRLRHAHDALSAANQGLAAKTAELQSSIAELVSTRARLVQEEKLTSVGRLASGIAHEINTPIQFVNDSIVFIRDAMKDVTTLIAKYQDWHCTLQDGRPWSEAAGEIAKAEQDADLPYIVENLPGAIQSSLDGLARVATIVRSVKEFAHPDQTEVTSVDLNHAIENTLTIARSEYKHVADVKMELGNLPPVACYASALNQAILNIIVNAAHAIAEVVKDTGQRGTITIRTQNEGASVVISIADSGVGIPREISDKIYDPFFTTKGVGKGTGQGLAIARSVIVDKHGGELSFETELGAGTTFFIRIPVAREPSVGRTSNATWSSPENAP